MHNEFLLTYFADWGNFWLHKAGCSVARWVNGSWDISSLLKLVNSWKLRRRNKVSLNIHVTRRNLTLRSTNLGLNTWMSVCFPCLFNLRHFPSSHIGFPLYLTGKKTSIWTRNYCMLINFRNKKRKVVKWKLNKIFTKLSRAN